MSCGAVLAPKLYESSRFLLSFRGSRVATSVCPVMNMESYGPVEDEVMDDDVGDHGAVEEDVAMECDDVVTCLTGTSANLRRTTIGVATPYREDDHTVYDEVQCSSDIQREASDSRSYRIHPLVRMCAEADGWSALVNVDCFHCCESFPGPPVRVPQSVDPQGVFMVRPTVFCSLSCAKAHLLERNAFDCSVQLLLLHRVARDVYGWTSTEIPTAPPRLCLQRFGGPLTVEKFRESSAKIGMRIIEPPFVPLQLMVESSGVWKPHDSAPESAHSPADRAACSQAHAQTHVQTHAQVHAEDYAPTPSLVSDEAMETGQGRTAIPAWNVRGLRRPDQPRCLPRADPTPGPSLLESYVESMSRGDEWRPDDHRGIGTITSKIPTNAEVNRAHNSKAPVAPTRRTLPSCALTEPKIRESRRAKRHVNRMPSNHEKPCQTLLTFKEPTPDE